ncbi:hypothetical protein DAPPUDRAFT_262327 [Daphnia pulex]|uniref:Uncharacterized protein n=1 Tax=Daphnia pulex TaxID=6669 RepID=E9HMQ9_DAPPU|nr:hypothetical protein DAPPUDRAFT_262327 [Daphnia pulex]|eukprot:EFX66966.1 hypothetical protein DAPPUDRAFT_262327 [Daphnia pulex]
MPRGSCLQAKQEIKCNQEKEIVAVVSLSVPASSLYPIENDVWQISFGCVNWVLEKTEAVSVEVNNDAVEYKIVMQQLASFVKLFTINPLAKSPCETAIAK